MTKIAIIGGSGKMGRWFARELKEEGFSVVISGRNRERLSEAARELGVPFASDNKDAVKDAGVILISVPIDSFEGVVKEISPLVKPGQIVVDFTSVKAMPVRVMHQYIKSGLILGMHPVFGPGAVSFSGHNFVLTPVDEREGALAAKVKEWLESRGANVSIMTAEEHDQMMSVVLGLAHFIAIVAADTLSGTGQLKELKAIGGITYRALLTLIESVISEDPELYAAIQMALPEMEQAHNIFLDRGRIWSDIVKNGNRAEFVTRMSALKKAFEESDAEFARAYENMYKLAQGE